MSPLELLAMVWVTLGCLVEGFAIHRATRLGHVNDLLVRVGLLGQSQGWSEEKTSQIVATLFVTGTLFGVLIIWPHTAWQLAKAMADDDLPGPWGHA
jgi:hypothetical protein